MAWLASFLEITFFGDCSVHKNLQNNELNRYCIDCKASGCKYCIAEDSHGGHKVLKIYRHVYKDVVLLEVMKTHIDCSGIQSYRCNKKLVISLKPLPHCGSGEADKDNACDVCMRKLYEPEKYSYCSIECKFSETTCDLEGDFNETGPKEEKESQRKRKRRRKGIPCRAPFF